MPFPIGSEVLVAISEPRALTYVRGALCHGRTSFSEVSRWNLIERRPAQVALVIYDLSPLDRTALDLLERARRTHPMVPFVLYAPPHHETGQLLIDAARLRVVHGLLQTGSPGDVQRLRRVIHRAFLEAPSAHAFRAMEDVLGDGVDLKIKLFLADVIRRIGPMESPPPAVEAIASTLNMSRRSLERLWRGTGLPGPKQMIDWATLVTLAGAADAVGEATGVLASRRGIDARRLYRLRRRLFGPKWPRLPKNPGGEFEALLMRFARACMNRRIWRKQRAQSTARKAMIGYVSASS